MQTKRKINMVVKNITHTSTQSTHSHKHTHTQRVHLRDTQKYAIKKKLTQTATAAINAASGRLVGVSKVSHIFLSLTFSFIVNFFFRFCICCINCQ